MNVIKLYLMLSIGGMVLAIFGGYLGGITGVTFGMFGGVMGVLAVFMIIIFAKNNGFLAFFRELKDDEIYAWVPDKLNKLHLLILAIKGKDILYKKDVGIFEHKGTEFNFGNNPMCFAYPDRAYTIDLPTEHYFSKIQKEKNLDEYEECVKSYLGSLRYKEFQDMYRVNPKPDFYEIEKELEYLIKNKPITSDGFQKNVFGTTVDFANRMKYLKYVYNPVSAENQTERERIIALKEGMDYKEEKQYIDKAKAIAIVLVVVMIVVIVLSQLDWSNVSKMFGG